MKESKILAFNMAIAKRAEMSAERQRVERGDIPFIRRPMIDRLYSTAPKVVEMAAIRRAKMRVLPPDGR